MPARRACVSIPVRMRDGVARRIDMGRFLTIESFGASPDMRVATKGHRMS